MESSFSEILLIDWDKLRTRQEYLGKQEECREK